MDALSEVLHAVRLSGSVFCRARLSGAWSVATRGAVKDASDTGHGDQSHLALFHAFLRGSGWLFSEDEAVHLHEGDLVILSRGQAHVLARDEDAAACPVPITALPAAPDAGGLRCVCAGGDPDGDTEILCGSLRLRGEAAAFLLPRLPPVLHASGGATTAWLDLTLGLLAQEVSDDHAGADAVRARLAEVLFIQALRAATRTVDRAGGPTWLRALDDPRIGRALSALHADPAEPWTMDALARTAGMSRSAFYQRFTDVLGEPPASYLVGWRMTLAREALRSPRRSVAEVAARVGYGSEAAFSKAFKREVGQSPSAWRRAGAAP